MGGGPRHVFDLATQLTKIGHQVFIASPNQAPFFEKFLTVSRSHFVLPHRSFSVVALIRLIAFCKKNQIQIIHSHGRAAGLYSRALKCFGFFVVHTFHGFHILPSLNARLMRLADQLLAPFTDVFICVSESERDKVLSAKAARQELVAVVPNGIKRLAGNHPPKLNQALVVARLDKIKGIDLLIEYAYQLKKNAEVELQKVILVGDGPEQNSLQEKISSLDLAEFVVSLGYQPDPSLLFAQSQFFLSASKGEGLPYTVLEALNSGCLCVLSRVPGHIEFEHIPGVFLFDLNSSDSFIAAMKLAVQSAFAPSLPAQYSLEQMAEQVIEVYKNLK